MEQASRSMTEQLRALKEMTTASENVARQVRVISAANREHSTAGNTILNHIAEVRRISDRNAAGAKETSASSEMLLRTAESLLNVIEAGGTYRSPDAPSRKHRTDERPALPQEKPKFTMSKTTEMIMKAIAIATVAAIMTVIVSAVAVQAADRPMPLDGQMLFEEIANQSTF